MKLGARLHQLSRRPRSVVLCGVLALLAGFLSIYDVGISPPGVHARALQIGAASTELLIDTPRSTIADLRQEPTSTALSAMTERSSLLGNVMASYPVRAYIARIVHLSPLVISVDAPITANVPRDQIEPGSGHTATDILASPDHYKLEIQTDPSGPIIYIYAQAPSTKRAIQLANASIQGLRNYLHDLSTTQKIPAAFQVRLTQLGQAQGGVVNGGANIEIAVLVALTVFSLSCFGALFVARVRRGWVLAGLGGRLQS